MRKSNSNLMPLMSGIALSAISALSLTGCGQEANPTITLQVGSLSASNKILDFFIPSAYAAVSSAKICIKRLRFKQADGGSTGSETSDGSDNIDFAPGEVTLAAGTTIGDVAIPAGTYKRLEFDLDRVCGNNNSVSFTNGSGSFTSQDTITVKFEGTFDASSSGQVLELGFGSIVSAMDGVISSSGNTIKNALEAASVKGSF